LSRIGVVASGSNVVNNQIEVDIEAERLTDEVIRVSI
jgi:hypothetical protein